VKATAAVVALLVVLRYGQQLEYILLAGFVGWLAVCCIGNRRGSRPFRAARYAATSPAGGRCGACAAFVADIAAHEAGHTVAAEGLGYRVAGAVVYPGDGGFTAIPGYGDDAWDTMVMAAAGAAGENRNRLIFKADINGSRSDRYSDAWWCHRLAPEIAKDRGITTAQAIAQAEAEANRLLSANPRRFHQATDVLTRDRQFGDIS
jgi:hypothetical protein